MARFRRCRDALAGALLLLLSSSGRAEPALGDGAAKTESRAAFATRVSGLLQVDGVPFHQASVDELDPATRAPLNETRFLIRRARIRLDAGYGYVHGLVQLDANTVRGPTVRLLAAELSVRYPREGETLIELGAGLMFIPFGFETMELANRRMFLEASSWVNAIFPGRRDLGARLAGAWQFLRYVVAVMNGNPSASAQLPLRDPNRGKDVIGRLGAEGPLFSFLEANFGLSGLWGQGFHAGTPPTKDTTVVRDVNEDGIVQLSEIQLVPGDPGEPSQNFKRYALGADLGFDYVLPVLGRGRSYGEIIWGKNLDRALFVADPIAQGRSLRELAFMLAMRQALTQHAELGVRYDRYDGDLDASDRQGVSLVPVHARVSTWAFALAWCSFAHLRVSVEYDHQKNPFGRSTSGRPTTLAADSLTLRAQLEL
jgi:hypothetical protein